MPKKKEYTLVCKHCGKEFHHNTPNKVYCSNECKLAHRVISICPICGTEFIAYNKQKYCSSKCRIIARDQMARERLVENSKNEYNGVENVDYVECKICGQRMTFFGPAHLRMHKITQAEYEEQYGKLTVYPSKFVDAHMMGDNNPNSSNTVSLQIRQERSPFSKEYYRKRGLNTDDREALIKQTAKNRICNTQLIYYLNKGLDEQSAKAALAKRQKIGMGGGYSSVSQKMILEILGDEKDSNKFFYGKREKRLSYKKDKITQYFRYDLTNEDSKRIIEFNGDFWHGNPNIYNDGSINTITKQTYNEIHDKDEYKYQVALKAGYAIMVIRESEYKNNHDDVISRCKNFILS